MKTAKTFKNGPAVLRILSDGSARYFYKTGVCSFEFSMFCEVGEPYKPLFEAIFKANKLKIAGAIEYDGRPWLADRVEVF